MNSQVLVPYFSLLESRPAVSWRGRVTQVVGNLLESAGPPCCLGECCEVRDSSGHLYPGEVVGFRGTTVLTMPLEKPSGVRYGDPVVAHGERPSIAVGEDLLGRVIDGAGHPLDGRGPCNARGAPQAGWRRPAGAGAAAHSRASGLRHSRHRRLPDLRARTAAGYLRRQRRRQEHADWDDGARHLGRFDGAGAGRRTRPRGRRISGRAGRSRTAALGGGGLHLGPVAAAAYPRGA